mgnify:CR=1 FL=1
MALSTAQACLTRLEKEVNRPRAAPKMRKIIRKNPAQALRIRRILAKFCGAARLDLKFSGKKCDICARLLLERPMDMHRPDR